MNECYISNLSWIINHVFCTAKNLEFAILNNNSFILCNFSETIYLNEEISVNTYIITQSEIYVILNILHLKIDSI